MSRKSRYVLRFLSICAAAAVIFSAVFMSACAFSREDWVRDMIEKYYYRFDGDYSSVSGMDGLSVDEMIARLDRYSTFYTAEKYKQVLSQNEGHKTGIGLNVEQGENCVLVDSVIGGSPSEAAGIKSGMRIVSVSFDGIESRMTSKDDFMNFVASVPVGESTALTFSDGFTAEVSKIEYTASYVQMYLDECNYSFVYEGGERVIVKGDAGIAGLPKNAAYVHISQFYGNAAEELHELAKIFNDRRCDSLILDLRGNGGGYVNVLAAVGGLFTSAVYGGDAVAMRARYKDNSEDIVKCVRYSSDVFSSDVKVYAMADSDTASASEALLGVLVSYNILEYKNIFLTEYADEPVRTYGKGIMQTMLTDASGEALKLTVAGVYWQNGKTVHDVGLTLADGCRAAPASDRVVSVGYDDEILPVIAAIEEENSKAEEPTE